MYVIILLCFHTETNQEHLLIFKNWIELDQFYFFKPSFCRRSALSSHNVSYNVSFTSASALEIYVSKPPLGACLIRACSISKLRKWIRC